MANVLLFFLISVFFLSLLYQNFSQFNLPFIARTFQFKNWWNYNFVFLFFSFKSHFYPLHWHWTFTSVVFVVVVGLFVYWFASQFNWFTMKLLNDNLNSLIFRNRVKISCAICHNNNILIKICVRIYDVPVCACVWRTCIGWMRWVSRECKIGMRPNTLKSRLELFVLSNRNY